MSRDENNSFRSVAPTLTAEKKKLFQIFLKAQKNKKTKKKPTHTNVLCGVGFYLAFHSSND